MSKQLVELMGGQIEMTSKPLVGVRVSVNVPLRLSISSKNLVHASHNVFLKLLPHCVSSVPLRVGATVQGSWVRRQES